MRHFTRLIHASLRYNTAEAHLPAASCCNFLLYRYFLHRHQIVDALLQHYDPYQPGSDTPLGAGPFLEATPSGSPTSSSAAAAAASVTSSAAGSRRSSQSGDGMCEIALVVKGVSGSGRVQGSAAKDPSKDGMV
jgi:hypothetical protein